jgi:glutamyl-tRNA(Gln) amidotransferase subunit D
MSRKQKSFDVEVGDKVVVQCTLGKFSGVVVPSTNPHVLILKLENGYNVGISWDRVKNVLKKGHVVIGKPKGKMPQQNPALPKISILSMGGTIASRVDYTIGGVYASFDAADLLTMVPELATLAQFSCRKLANIMSEDMRFTHYSMLAEYVYNELERGAKGIIITHGTDTMHFTAAALSFALEGLNAPVLLVGAQRSSDRPSSDSAENLIAASHFITKSDFAGVGICMHASTSDGRCFILPGTKTRKMHTSRRDAFQAINTTPVAEVLLPEGKINFMQKDYTRVNSASKPRLRNKFEEKVGLIKTYPGMSPEQFEFFLDRGYRGLIIEGTGLGHTPVNLQEGDARFIKIIKALIDSGCVVGIVSQCIYGRVHPYIYANLRRLSHTGAIFCQDMLAETAYVKLAWLLGNFDEEYARQHLAKNLRGEISERTAYI